MKEKLKNMKVSGKMKAYGVIMIAIIIFLGVVASAASILMNMQTRQITTNWMPSLTLGLQLDTLTSDYRLQEYAHISTTDSDEKIIIESRMQEISAEIYAKIEELESYFVMDEEYDMLSEILDSWAKYQDSAEEIIILSRTEQEVEARVLMTGESKTIYDDFGTKFDELVEFERSHTDDSSTKANTLFYIVLIVVAVVIIVSIIIVIYISKTMTSLIVTPLQRVDVALNRLYKEGNLDFSLEYESKDEFGDMVNTISSFVQALVSIIKDENQLMAEMAKGNFNINSKVKELYIGDFEEILLSLRGIKTKLGETLHGIAASADQVNAASGQMSQEAQNLADGATTQASAVEQILSSIEEVQQQSLVSASQAVDASKRAEDVKNQAEQSNQQMKNMVSEMNLITETSREISTIIDTIESIASQTNLLSLNASIEAARAGEAGRGFAVVADEIGKLALQCSQSANTTRELIEKAIVQTEKGNKIAGVTATALAEVAEGISKITEQIEQVQVNCEQQHASLEEVDRGMEEITSIVELNSASAQETSATSEELAAHAETLNSLLERFDFGEE